MILSGLFCVAPALCRADTYPAAFTSPSQVPITASGFNATGHVIELSLAFAPEHGLDLTVIENTARDFITGTFANLAQGQAVDLNYAGRTYRFIANYYGGSGNDLVLQWAATRLMAWGDNEYGRLGNGDTKDRELPTPVAVTSALANQTIIGMAAGPSHSLALRADGKVIAWGSNGSGKLGDGTTTDRFEPISVDQLILATGERVVAVDAGGSFSVALTSEGRVFAWGYNGNGQLGNGKSNITPDLLPVAVKRNGLLAGRKVVAISAGSSHVLALCADGTLAAWGDNSSGQLGNGGTVSSNEPVAVDASGALAGKSVIAIAAGYFHNLALCSDGTLVAWGANDKGYLGDGTTTPSAVPLIVSSNGVLAGKTVVRIAAGTSHSLAACSDGTLAAWGFNGWGWIGEGTQESIPLPVEVNRSAVPAGSPVRSLCASAQNSLAVFADGGIFTWGSSWDGRLGSGRENDLSSPSAVSSEPLSAGEVFLNAKIGMNSSHALAVTAIPPVPRIRILRDSVPVTAGGGACNLGSAPAGAQVPVTLQLQNPGIVPLDISQILIEGRDAADFTVTPPSNLQVPAGGSVAFSVSFHASSGFERRASLRISSNDPFLPEFTCGLSATLRGNLAAQWSEPDEVPLSVTGLDPVGSTVGLSLAFAPTTGATLKLIEHSGPGLIEGSFDNLTQGQEVSLAYQGITYRFIADYFGGDGNDLVLHWANTQLFAWGSDSESQLGDGGQTSRSLPYPVPLPAASPVMKVATGSYSSFALMADGSVQAWGGNFSGQLGIGSSVNSQPVPTALDLSGILAGRKVVTISSGEDFSLALCADGTLAAWGWNTDGQLGPATGNSSSSVPLLLPPLGALAGKRVLAIATGQSHSLALCTDGSIASWGDNWHGELGNGGSLDQSVPVAVSTKGVLALKRVIAIAAGNDHSLALCDDGTLAAWGDNSAGQLGDGTTEYRRLPVAVDRTGALAGKTVVAIAAGLYHSLALCADGTMVGWGSNSDGQLGVEGTGDRLVPVAVPASGDLAGRSVVGIAANRVGSLALCADGQAIQLGSDSFSDNPVAARVSTSTLPAGARFAALSSSPLASHLLGIAGLPPVPQLQVEDSHGQVLVSASSTLSFPGTVTGACPNQTLVLRNLRGGPLVVSGITFTGPDAADFVVSRPPLGAISAGATATLQVAFTPHDTGPRQAVMHLASNDPAAPFDLPLAATADSGSVLDATFHASGDLPLSSHGFSATGKQVAVTLAFDPPLGTELTIVENTAPGFITGQFDNLSHGQEIALDYQGTTHAFVANYYGGDGNDLTLVPARCRLLSWGANASGNLGNGGTLPGLVPAAVNQRGVLFGKTILTVATGASHSLALCSDGTLAAWGLNTSGQLGNGSNTSSALPVPVDTSGVLSGRRVVALAAGDSFSLALCSDGKIAAWGFNSSGQLGNGSTTNSTVPVLVNDSGVLSGRVVTAISAGSFHCLALSADGSIFAWGSNWSGVLGNDTLNSPSSNIPVAVSQSGVLAGKQVIAVSAGGSHSMALCADGLIAAWGNNTRGQLGTGSISSSDTPVLVSTAGVLEGKIVTRIAAGGSHSLALSRDGECYTWGDNSSLQLGAPGISPSRIPLRLAASGAMAGRHPIAASAGSAHSLLSCEDGSLVAWGGDSSGQLGNNSSAASSGPVLVDSSRTIPGARFILVSQGISSHHLAVVAEPPAPEIHVEFPEGPELTTGLDLVDLPLLELGASGARALTIRNRGETPLSGFSFTIEGPAAADFQVNLAQPLIAAGATSQLGISFTPQAVGPRRANFRILSNDPLTPAFEVLLSGQGSGPVHGVVGDPALPAAAFDSLTATGSTLHLSLDRTPPPGAVLTAVRITGNRFIEGEFANLSQGQEVQLSFAGRSYAYMANYYGGSGNDLVLHPRGARALAWGANTYGQLGTGNSTAQSFPAVTLANGVLTGKTVVALAAGERHSLALCSDGQLASWGFGGSGQLGRGSFSTSSSPVAVTTTTGALLGKRVVAVAAGSMHSLALCSDGTVAAWGDGFSGQLGNGSTATNTRPVAVSFIGALAGKSVVAIAAGANHSLALCSDGSLAAWGNNSSGQLGIGNTTSSSVPVAVNMSGVLAGKSVVAIAAGISHSLALCSDGSIASWGNNDTGALGDGSANTRTLPVFVTATGVLAGHKPVAITAGEAFSVTLCDDGFLASWGWNAGGKLGDGTSFSRLSPVAVRADGPLAGSKVLRVAAYAQHVIATLADGTLVSWGQNGSGRLGNGTTTASSVPVLVSTTSPPPGGAFIGASSGGCSANHSLALQVETPDLFFESWAAAKGLNGSPGMESGFSDDPDGDGIANGLEWILQGNPLAQDAPALIETSASDTSGLTLVFHRAPDSLGAKLDLEWDSDLTDEFAFRVAIGRSGQAANGSNPQVLLNAPEPGMVTVTIPATNGRRIFARLKADPP